VPNGPGPATCAGAGRANVCRLYSGPDEEIEEHFLVEGLMKKIRDVLQRAPTIHGRFHSGGATGPC
jgi:hypothetical protein